MYVHPHVCPFVCVIVAASVCMHVLHVYVPACVRTQQLMIHGYVLYMAKSMVKLELFLLPGMRSLVYRVN